MFELSLLICGLAVILCLWRVALGPTAYDRILAVNAVGSLVIIGITLHGFFMGRPEFIDIAILYALIKFIGTISILKFSPYPISFSFFLIISSFATTVSYTHLTLPTNRDV